MQHYTEHGNLRPRQYTQKNALVYLYSVLHSCSVRKLICICMCEVIHGHTHTWSPSAKLAVMCSDRFWAQNLSKRPWSQLKQR